MWLNFRGKALCFWLIFGPVLIGCSGGDESAPVSPTVISVPDTKPQPNLPPNPPIPAPIPAPIDGLLEIGTGERPTLTVHAFYDADKNYLRGPDEIALERAGLRLTPVMDGPNGSEKTGPGRIVRTSKEGVLDRKSVV